MAILKFVKVGSDVVQRCDAKCYNATTEKCNCCCGGKNHGVGLEQAMQNMRREFGPAADVLVEFGGVEVQTKPELTPWPKKPVQSAPTWNASKLKTG